MADRVAVFNQGRIEQVGTPEEIYERPRTAFVADFVGGSNVVEPATVASAGPATRRPASLRPEKIALLADRRRPPADAIVGRRHASAQVLYHGAMQRGRDRRPASGPLIVAVPAAAAGRRPGRSRPRRLRARRRCICMDDA